MKRQEALTGEGTREVRGPDLLNGSVLSSSLIKIKNDFLF